MKRFIFVLSFIFAFMIPFSSKASEEDFGISLLAAPTYQYQSDFDVNSIEYPFNSLNRPLESWNLDIYSYGYPLGANYEFLTSYLLNGKVRLTGFEIVPSVRYIIVPDDINNPSELRILFLPDPDSSYYNVVNLNVPKYTYLNDSLRSSEANVRNIYSYRFDNGSYDWDSIFLSTNGNTLIEHVYDSMGRYWSLKDISSSKYFMFFKDPYSVEQYIKNGDESGLLNPTVYRWDDESLIDASMPVPDIRYSKTNFGSEISISNATSNYFVEVRGSWTSIDDINIFTDRSQFFVSYGKVFHSPVTNAVTYKNKMPSTTVFNFSSLNDILPVTDLNFNPSRNFILQKDASGNVLSVVSTFASSMASYFLDPTSSGLVFNHVSPGYDSFSGRFVVPNLYMRFYTLDSDGKPTYGKYGHFTMDLTPSGSNFTLQPEQTSTYNTSDIGLTPSQVKDQFSSDELNFGTYLGDQDLVTNAPTNSGFDLGKFDFQDLPSYMEAARSIVVSVYSYAGTVPQMVNTTFSFVPAWIRVFFLACFVSVCIIGVIKALL